MRVRVAGEPPPVPLSSDEAVFGHGSTLHAATVQAGSPTVFVLMAPVEILSALHVHMLLALSIALSHALGLPLTFRLSLGFSFVATKSCLPRRTLLWRLVQLSLRSLGNFAQFLHLFICRRGTLLFRDVRLAAFPALLKCLWVAREAILPPRGRLTALFHLLRPVLVFPRGRKADRLAVNCDISGGHCVWAVAR